MEDVLRECDADKILAHLDFAEVVSRLANAFVADGDDEMRGDEILIEERRGGDVLENGDAVLLHRVQCEKLLVVHGCEGVKRFCQRYAQKNIFYNINPTFCQQYAKKRKYDMDFIVINLHR